MAAVVTRLTLSEMGIDQARKTDCRRYRGPLAARIEAGYFGGLAVAHIESLKRSLMPTHGLAWYSEAARDLFVEDAVMFARMAVRGWRAYRVMEGE